MADDAVGVRPAGLGKAGAVGGALARCLRRAVAWCGLERSSDSTRGLPWWAEIYLSALSTRTPIPPARKPARRPARRLRPH
jgi:hypothetical protein